MTRKSTSGKISGPLKVGSIFHLKPREHIFSTSFPYNGLTVRINPESDSDSESTGKDNLFELFFLHIFFFDTEEGEPMITSYH